MDSLQISIDMAWFSVLAITVTLLSLSAQPTFSIPIPIRFLNRNFPTKAGDLLFLGDAQFVGDTDSFQLTRPKPLSFGIMLSNSPFRLSSATSLSSNITFEIGNGVSLVIIPADFPSKFATNTSFGLLDANPFLSVEFNVDVCKISSSRVSNVSKTIPVLKHGVKLTSWIDYRAIFKRLDVRVSKLGDPKPVEPLISHRIDLGEILNGDRVLMGLASSNEKRDLITSVYSWSSEMIDAPKWLHSIPVNPQEHSTVQTSKNKGCFLSGFIFATGCGALAALILFFVWSYAVDRQKIQGEASVHPVDFKYEKIGVLKVKNSEDTMK